MRSLDLSSQVPMESVNAESLPSDNSSKKIIFALLYFSAIPFFLFLLVISALFVRQAANQETNGFVSFSSQLPKYQAVPEESPNSNIEVAVGDARIKSLDEFFKSYKSPLFGHAHTIVEEADKHGIDYRLIPAIAMQESTLCKKIIKDSNNCWGFGIYGKKVTKFDNFDQAITTVTATLAKKYIAQGLNSPEEIMSKYTPSNDGAWADAVTLVMGNLKDSL